MGLLGPEAEIGPWRMSPTVDFLLISREIPPGSGKIHKNLFNQYFSRYMHLLSKSSTVCGALPNYMILLGADNKAFSSCVVKRPLRFLQLLPYNAVITVYFFQLLCPLLAKSHCLHTHENTHCVLTLRSAWKGKGAPIRVLTAFHTMMWLLLTLVHNTENCSQT